MLAEHERVVCARVGASRDGLRPDVAGWARTAWCPSAGPVVAARLARRRRTPRPARRPPDADHHRPPLNLRGHGQHPRRALGATSSQAWWRCQVSAVARSALVNSSVWSKPVRAATTASPATGRPARRRPAGDRVLAVVETLSREDDNLAGSRRPPGTSACSPSVVLAGAGPTLLRFAGYATWSARVTPFIHEGGATPTATTFQ